jgi:ferredoxin
MGEIGYSKVFLTPEFGPRQRFGAIMTNAPLEPDPIFEGHLCDRCMRCAKTCSGRAISTTETVKIRVAGHDVEWGKLDEMSCREAFRGGNPELNPFFSERVPENIMWHGEAWEGGCGCIRECMIHLEQRGVLKNEFKEPFRRKPPWRLPADWREKAKAEAAKAGKNGKDAEEQIS